MGRLRALLRKLDEYQRAHRWLAWPLAVNKKYGDDQAGNQAALITYYAFFSLFPLLLVAVTVLGLLLAHNPSLQHRVLSSALKDFPVLGTQLRENIHSLNRTGVGLGLGLVGTFYGARGVASAAQNAFNHVWNVPKAERPGFPQNTLRSFGLIIVGGGGIILTTALSGFGSGSATPGIRIVAFVVALALNVLVFWACFRLAIAKTVSGRDFRLAAVIAAVVWQVLQGFGTFLVSHELKNASEVYGTFAFIIGLLWWIYFQTQFTLYALEVDVVRARRLVPRSLVQPPLTTGDERAFRLYVGEERRRRATEVEVRLNEPVDTPPSSDGDRTRTRQAGQMPHLERLPDEGAAS
ncbi:MAG TPA: ribonuclease BN [Acidimicrobiaceae bacterium]|nr:ribonuclease BN [Acidimicrobiaceae bacterium]